jgi:Kef-type K+ transport system membrane component KefB
LPGLRSGRVVPLVTANRFIEAGAEIGLILLLFTLGFVDRRAATSAPA